jgi:hypothetical protein
MHACLSHRPTLIPVFVAAFTLLGACDPRNRSVLDEEPADAGVDALTAAPMCPYAPMPPAECRAFVSPAPACVVDLDGRTLDWQVTFDAAGRQIGYTSYVGVSRSSLDETGRVERQEYAVDGCVTDVLSFHRLGEGRLTRRWNRWEDTCSFVVEHRGEVVLSEHDRDCDCRDVRPSIECEMGPHGPVRCVGNGYEGAPHSTTTYTYDAVGRRVGERNDWDTDGVPEREHTVVFDAAGREAESCTTCTDCDDSEGSCWYYTYEEDPRRVTRRRDEGGDGSVEDVWRTTYDGEGRVVLEEFGAEDAVITRIATAYDDRGGYRLTRTERGQVTATDELVIEDGRRTRTWMSVDGDRERVHSTVFGEHGGLIERVQIQRDGGELIELRHDLYSRDARGLLSGQRSQRMTADGQTSACTIGYRWSGPCPVPPVDFEGGGCLLTEP